MIDALIVGGGPAGCTAAIYLCRAGYRVRLLDTFNSSMVRAHRIENYPGFAAVSGQELSVLMEEQAKAAGAPKEYGALAALEATDDGFFSRLENGEEIASRTVLLATGTTPRKLGVPGEDDFVGRGVSYCAACDGGFFRGRCVAVVGGGNTALTDALYLASIAEHVYLIHRRDTFRGDRVLVDRVRASDKITLLLENTVAAIEGEHNVECVCLGNGETIEVSGVFLAVGSLPNCPQIPSEVERDASGYLRTDATMQTSLPGLFAAGDLRATPLRQISTAVGDGAIAAEAMGEYLIRNADKR